MSSRKPFDFPPRYPIGRHEINRHLIELRFALKRCVEVLPEEHAGVSCVDVIETSKVLAEQIKIVTDHAAKNMYQTKYPGSHLPSQKEKRPFEAVMTTEPNTYLLPDGETRVPGSHTILTIKTDNSIVPQKINK